MGSKCSWIRHGTEGTLSERLIKPIGKGGGNEGQRQIAKRTSKDFQKSATLAEAMVDGSET